MATVLITGANRGLGLEFCKQYAKDGWTVIACCRKPEQSTALKNLAQQYAVIQIESLDVANFAHIDALSEKLSGTALDVLINNAGVYGDTQAKRFGQLDYETWTETLRINTLVPVKMAEAFLNQIRLGEKKLIANISSLMGSMADNTSGGNILYRSSKAGLNAAMKSLSIDLEPEAIGVLILHPGWVKTDMGGANAQIDTNESISGMRTVIANFSLAQSGQFVKYDGSLMQW